MQEAGATCAGTERREPPAGRRETCTSTLTRLPKTLTIWVRREWRLLPRRRRAADTCSCRSPPPSSTVRCHTMPVTAVLGAMRGGGSAAGCWRRSGSTTNSVSTTTAPAPTPTPVSVRPSPVALPGACQTAGGAAGGGGARRASGDGRCTFTRPGPPTAGRCRTQLSPYSGVVLCPPWRCCHQSAPPGSSTAPLAPAPAAPPAAAARGARCDRSRRAAGAPRGPRRAAGRAQARTTVETKETRAGALGCCCAITAKRA